MRSTARACANIALIKYWGRADPELNLPLNASLSMNLADLVTETTVEFLDVPGEDVFVLDGRERSGPEVARVSRHLDRLRARAEVEAAARVESRNGFPAGAGLASSASGFAALTVAAASALGLPLAEPELSRLARLGSGSACRSVPGGFVEWPTGSDATSHGRSLHPAGHWELWDVIALVEEEAKGVSSLEGHRLALSSPFLGTRLNGLPGRLAGLRRALAERDFATLARATEEDALELHLVAMTSRPSIVYWQPGTVQVLQHVKRLSRQGLPVCFTMDAGANVHCLTPAQHRRTVEVELTALPLVERVLSSPPGGPAEVVE